MSSWPFTGIDELQGCLYIGRIMHHRLRPKRHRFVYRAFTMLLDIDRLNEIEGRLRLFSVDRPNLFAFYHRDHGERDGRPLRPWIEAELGAAGVQAKPARILMLAMPRMLGFVFNPLTLYYVLDRQNRPVAVVYEVKNTFGDQHAYVLGTDPDDDARGTIRQSCAKDFYVSPFIEAEARYHFRLRAPDQRLSVLIQETTAAGPLLTASLTGERHALTDRRLLLSALRHPLLSYKVVAGIHLEALRLWLKRIPIQPRFHTSPAGIGSTDEQSGRR
jgi:DUF1365 family protein